MKILTNKTNQLFNRKEITVTVEKEVTPKIKEAEEMISKELSTNAENVKIKEIKGNFGSGKFLIRANVYNSPEEKNKTETRTKKTKKQEAKKE